MLRSLITRRSAHAAFRDGHEGDAAGVEEVGLVAADEGVLGGVLGLASAPPWSPPTPRRARRDPARRPRTPRRPCGSGCSAAGSRCASWPAGRGPPASAAGTASGVVPCLRWKNQIALTISGRAGVSRWMSSVATICAATPAVRSAGRVRERRRHVVEPGGGVARVRRIALVADAARHRVPAQPVQRERRLLVLRPARRRRRTRSATLIIRPPPVRRLRCHAPVGSRRPPARPRAAPARTAR